MDRQQSNLITAATNGVQDKLASSEFQERFGLGSGPVDDDAMMASVTEMLLAIGEDPGREGLINTPRRVAKAYHELASGYRVDPSELLNNAIFNIACDDMIIVSDIEFYSLCEHHVLPFIGHAHVAYMPGDRVIGLSKIPRIVDMFSRRLQVQERLTRQIADFLLEVLEPKGVAVVMTARHMCSMIRGVMKHDSQMTTSAMLGFFRDNQETRNEFLMHIQRSGRP